LGLGLRGVGVGVGVKRGGGGVERGGRWGRLWVPFGEERHNDEGRSSRHCSQHFTGFKASHAWSMNREGGKGVSGLKKRCV